jgi:hypothetical protein
MIHAFVVAAALAFSPACPEGTHAVKTARTVPIPPRRDGAVTPEVVDEYVCRATGSRPSRPGQRPSRG